MDKKYQIIRLQNNKRLTTIRVCAAISVTVILSTLYRWTQTPEIPKNKGT